MIQLNNPAASDILRNNNIKVTKQREDILNILLDAQKSLSAEDIFMILKTNGADYSLSTVYRVLASFLTNRIIDKSDLPETSTQYYTLAIHGHKHLLVCTNCKKSVEIDDCPFENFANDIGEKNGFEITDHSLEIFGVCKNCQNNPYKQHQIKS